MLKTQESDFLASEEIMENIASLATTLRGSIENDVHKVENIEIIEREHPGEAATELEDLKEDLLINEGRAREIVDNISTEQIRFKELQSMVFGLNGEMKKLNGKLQEHEKKHSELQDDHEKTKNELSRLVNSLHTGQIAFDFEKDLAKYIYPDGKKFGSRKIFTEMKKWLESKKDTRQGKEAKKKWNALEKEFSWSTEHENVFFKLLESRKTSAHPIVDWNLARSRIPDNFTEQERKCIDDIIAITKHVNELMAKDSKTTDWNPFSRSAFFLYF